MKMNKVQLLLILATILLFSSCGAENDKNQESSDSLITNKIETNPCDRTTAVDISDSIHVMLEEIHENKCNYNSAKFDVAMKRWDSKYVEFSDVVVTMINVADEYTNNFIATRYKGSYECAFLPQEISIFVGIDTKEELTNFEVGDVVSVSGLICPPSKSDEMGFNIHLKCATAEKK